MDTDQPPRVRHPVQGLQQAIDNYGRICGVRGYCGPFVNAAVYDAFPDPMWRGCAECAVCGSTCLVAHEEAKRERAERKVGLISPTLEA